MELNIRFIKNCFGCGVCSASCPKGIISIGINKEGFYGPQLVNPDNCTNCGICLDVCAFNHKEHALKPEETIINSWAAWSNDKETRKRCSSGGIGFEIGKQLIEQGYKAVGCRYNINKQRAEHYIATTIEEYVHSIGSKYIQSYTEDAFKQINRKGEKYIVTGTPCQIDSFRRMIRKFRCEDNFILMDFYCHCVPSIHAWKNYLKMNESVTGTITGASWRNKPTGWHDSWVMRLQGTKGDFWSWKSQGDWFYKMFLGDVCMGPQCYKDCKYKYDKSSADIRIGDLWGDTYIQDDYGVNALVTFTSKGKEIVEGLQNITLIEHPFDIVAEGQMKENAKPQGAYGITMFLLKHNIYLSEKQWEKLYRYFYYIRSRVLFVYRKIKGA